MEIFVNKEKLSFELENEKNAYDIVTALTDFYAKEKPQQFIIQVSIDGKEYSYSDEEGLAKIELSGLSKMEFEFRDIVGFSLLSIRQIILYLDFVADLIKQNQWSDPIENAMDSFRWMEQGVEQIVAIFKEDQANLLLLQDKFRNKYEVMGKLFLPLKKEDFPLDDLREKEISLLIKEMQTILLKFYQSLSMVNNTLTKEEMLANITKLLTSFEQVIPTLSEVSIKLQKGDDRGAMDIIQKLSTLIDSSISIFLIYKESNPDYFETLKVKELSFENFFDQMTVHLKELMEAIENKDSVMIGDLVEYEFLPNMYDINDLLVKLKHEFVNKIN